MVNNVNSNNELTLNDAHGYVLEINTRICMGKSGTNIPPNISHKMEDKTHDFRQASINLSYAQNRQLFSFTKLWFMRLRSKNGIIEMDFICFFLQIVTGN